MDSGAHRLTLELEGERLVWELHPTRGWLRPVADPTTGTVAEAVEGWGGRRIRTQRRPRVRRVAAPPDERWLEIEIDAGGPDRASRFVVELMTNQWNALALAPDGTILSALRSRAVGSRVLRTGVPYQPPSAAGRAAREGADEPVGRDRFIELLSGLPPGDRSRALVKAIAWTSPLNATAILGDAAVEAAALEPAWNRYRHLAARPAADPHVLELDRPTPYPLSLPGVPGRAVPSLLASFETVADEPGRSALAPEVRAALEDRLERTRARAERMRIEAQEAPAKATALRRRADLLMAQLHRVAKGDRTVTLDDFEGGTVTVELDPALTPPDNARELYDRARKRERAALRLPERVRAVQAEQHRLEALLQAMDERRADPVDVAEAIAEVRPRDGAATAEAPRLPYRRFRSSGGLEIRVGRAGRANDELTFRHSSPDDIWLHARDAAGAHVILRWGDRDRNPPRRDLIEAALLAALNSRARTSGTVPVDWTRRKHVRKPRNAPAGTVIPDRVSTLFVEPDPTLPDRLDSD
jgi:predicted ribosome quality control (RQC) complex YloA/Tae2 family protein